MITSTSLVARIGGAAGSVISNPAAHPPRNTIWSATGPSPATAASMSATFGFSALTIRLQPLGEFSGGEGALTGPPAPNRIHEHQKLVKPAILHRGFWSRPENWQEGFAANLAFGMRPHWDNVLGVNQLFGQWRCAVTGRHPASEFSPPGNTEIFQAMNQELLQISCLGRYSAVAPKGQLRGQSAFNGRVHLGGAHTELDGKFIVRPDTRTHRHEL